jgi:NAD(P)-dependent dehydrogenase (short-subunit alcohol dehydrogenase family)
VVHNAGVYGPRTQGLQTPSREEFDLVMHTNLLGAMRVLPSLAAALAPGARVALLSSRMGSIGLRSSSSGWLYRASKAALNSVLKDAALEWQGRALCVALHPGWVRTDMGGSGAEIDAATSVAGMRRVIGGLSADDHGAFFDWSGARLAW